MKYHVLFSLKNMKKYLRMSSAAVLIGTSRVKGNSLLVFGASSFFSSPEPKAPGELIV